MKLNLNFQKAAQNDQSSSVPQASAPKKPLAIFQAAMEEDDEVAAPMSQRELINLQIIESAKKNSRQAMKLQAEAMAKGEAIFDIDSHLKDDNDIPAEIQLPEKQTMRGGSRYLGQILKAKERRDRDKLVASEHVEKLERQREEGEFGDKEKFITESYQRQLELNKKEEMILEVEEKLNQSKTLSNTGMMSFYNNMLDNKLEKDTDIREKAKQKVIQGTNIDKILDANEAVREEERKKRDEKKKQEVLKEVQQILTQKLKGDKPKEAQRLDSNKKRVEKELEKQTQETEEEKKEREKREREEKIRKAKERYNQRKTHGA